MLTTCFVMNFTVKRKRNLKGTTKSERYRFCHKLSKESIGTTKGIVGDESLMVLAAQ